STKDEHHEKGNPMLAALPTVIDEEPKSWEAKARCRDGSGALTHLFFSEELQDIARAKRICAECPVIEPCLSGALERREPWGVWGGQLILNGRILANKRRRGRPPKHPRPEDQLPVIPIPEALRETVGAAVGAA
ncbi:MAG: WhiB family transcriptional regulator, partial [Acidimicrobiales bacterium]